MIKTQAKLDLIDVIKVLYEILWEIFIVGMEIFLFLAMISPSIGLIVSLSDWKNHSIWDILFFIIFSIVCGVIAWIIRDLIPMFFKSLKIKINELKNYQKDVIEATVSKKEIWDNKDEVHRLIHYYLILAKEKYEVSTSQYNQIRQGDKVIIEMMPESKLILSIKKVK